MQQIAPESKIQIRQDLRKHRVGVDRFFNMSERNFCMVEAGFKLQKSTVLEIHEFITTMAQEREVALSD